MCNVHGLRWAAGKNLPFTRVRFTITNEWPLLVSFKIFSGLTAMGCDNMGCCMRTRSSAGFEIFEATPATAMNSKKEQTHVIFEIIPFECLICMGGRFKVII